MVYERIRDLREDADMKQKDVAAYLKCSQRVYSNYECGGVNPPLHSLVKLAELHHTSVDYLLNVTDVKQPYPKKKR